MKGAEVASLTVAMTGAAGRVGRAIRPELDRVVSHVRLLDISTPRGDEQRGDWVAVDIRDLATVCAAVEGMDVIVHLAGIADEAPFHEILETNIVGTYNVFEAARRNSVRRVVFASTNHVVGFYPVADKVGPEHPTRPDTFYAVSKVTGEALGRLYHAKWGLEVVCIRIGSFRDQPTLPRHRSTWLSVKDGARLISQAVTAPGLGFLTVFGVSANSQSWWDVRSGYEALGFVPEDDAASLLTESSNRDVFQGGAFVDPDYMGGLG